MSGDLLLMDMVLANHSWIRGNYMKVYVTFGQDHAHSVGGKTFDKNCVASIECKDYGHGRELAFEIFGDKWCFAYNEQNINTVDIDRFFPRGIIEV